MIKNKKTLFILLGIAVLFLLLNRAPKKQTSPSNKKTEKTTITPITKVDKKAVAIISSALKENKTKIQINPNKLITIPNPKGEGIIVYYPETQFLGVKRYLIWIVIDNDAYPLNGASKNLTPNLKWPREADEKIWNKTGLDKFDSIEIIKEVFKEN